MTYDMRRGMPRIDPTMPRTKCPAHHGSHVPQSYLGRERYGCYHCALAEWDAREDALAILRAANIDERATEVPHPEWTEAPDEVPGPCSCATCL